MSGPAYRVGEGPHRVLTEMPCRNCDGIGTARYFDGEDGYPAVCRICSGSGMVYCEEGRWDFSVPVPIEEVP